MNKLMGLVACLIATTVACATPPGFDGPAGDWVWVPKESVPSGGYVPPKPLLPPGTYAPPPGYYAPAPSFLPPPPAQVFAPSTTVVMESNPALTQEILQRLTRIEKNQVLLQDLIVTNQQKNEMRFAGLEKGQAFLMGQTEKILVRLDGLEAGQKRIEGIALSALEQATKANEGIARANEAIAALNKRVESYEQKLWDLAMRPQPQQQAPQIIYMGNQAPAGCQGHCSSRCVTIPCAGCNPCIGAGYCLMEGHAWNVVRSPCGRNWNCYGYA